MTDATAILVLGMHRSGTSATTRVLNLLGADLGANLLEAQADNAKGFWEHAEAVEIHEELLTALGRTWHDIREMPDDWLEQPASYAAIDKIVRLIRRDFGDSKLWAVKDPRMCRLVPLWKDALRRTGMHPVALVVVRKPEDVAGSLQAREGWSEAHADLMWMQHTLEAIRHTGDMPRSVIGYDDLLANWRKSVARIGTELGITWPRQGEEVSRQIDAFLSPEDRHHHSTEEAATTVETTGSRSAVEQLYALCADVAEGHTSWSALEQFDTRYLEAAHLYRGVAQQKYELDDVALERVNHIRLVESELQFAGERIAESSSLSVERANHIQLLSGQLQQIIDVATERQARIDDLEQVAAERTSRLQLLEGELQGTTARLQSVSEELHAVRTTVADLSVRHGRQIAENEALSLRCAELDDALQKAQAQRGEAVAELTHLREHRELLSQTYEQTFSRRWLLRRIWDVTLKKSTLRPRGPTG